MNDTIKQILAECERVNENSRVGGIVGALASQKFADFAARVLPGLVEALVEYKRISDLSFSDDNYTGAALKRALSALETAWKEAGK